MVATRRGVRVYSPSKTESSDVQATPSTARRTRRTAKEADGLTQDAETSSQPNKCEEGPPTSSPTSSVKRCTRASRLHSPELPSTPVGSTHEADMSDLESCCSAVSDIEPLVTRIRGRKRQPRTVGQEEEDISEVESCSSAVSASKAVRSSRRSTRKKTLPESPDSACVEKEDVKADQVLETESCSSVVSESKRVTRSQRKSARTRSSAKQLTEDSEVSDADSCMSSVSGADISRSAYRRATRSVRRTGPIPMHLDEPLESCQSPATPGRRTRAARGKPAASADVSEPQSCESEGFESGPTYSMATRRRTKTASSKVMDSESELTDGHSPAGSPCSVQGRGTPCSSRTGSGNSSRGTRASRRTVKDLSVVVEKVGEPSEEDSSLNDSRLESTVIAMDADCTLLEEEKEVNVISEGESHVSSLISDMAGCEEAAGREPAVITKDQQEELSTENNDRDTSEMEVMQEIIPSSKPTKPCQSVTVTICDKASEITEEKVEAVEVADVDAHSSQGDKAQPSVVEKMEVSTLNTDDEQVADSSELQSESIRVTSKQQHKITVDCDSEQQPKDVIVQNAKVISLLESSDDEDEYDEEEEEVDGSEEEDVEYREGERGILSKKSESASTSVERLFMIDTRPGQEADEQYYKERSREQEEEAEQEAQDEEFVDEEGDDDDDDDEDAEILYSSRNPLSKELSSRIDPGIRVKALGGLYINFDGSKSKPVSGSLLKRKEKKIQDEVMKKSVIGPDFEKKDAVPPYSESKQALKLKRREERGKSTGDGWFNMKAPEISQELKGDLQVLKMRGSVDPKRFYKKNDRDGFPKYFQIGTVVDSAVDFYHSRVPKKERKRTMVEELLHDAEFRQNNKKKYQNIMIEKAAQGAGRRNKKKNKFHKK
ncbi:deoxynucleotidyltransferase terminal-interacting protein 2 [Anabas testudineus]|uniref:Fcf2 pre-rRNA processing C-terminal domain-containing protein n=1 Tax=Anabas testudineus TaxID=64144 RepID=A0A3Q1HMD5_ANATE|nr:deoxynucleotidyltransferase terminal-interacting protein 2 [Anabas testudineus]